MRKSVRLFCYGTLVVIYLGVIGCTGVAGSRRILGLGGQGSTSSSPSRASVSIEEPWRTVACDSFHIPSLWSLVTSFVRESLEANGEVTCPIVPAVPALKAG
ncbi:hypothetical protein PUN28_005351 [Cardiocondyla obscurior]|uniref:Secreted protein n=1 Tax=Cardiocondyla obscurior TaxID=286306 RepID=A0AAW2GIA5_9HYME